MIKKYIEVSPISKKEAEVKFMSDDSDEICKAMVSIAYFEPDWKWAQDIFLDFLGNKEVKISSLAATCIGHLARIHRKIEKEKVIYYLTRLLENDEIRGYIEDAINDIEIFIPSPPSE